MATASMIAFANARAVQGNYKIQTMNIYSHGRDVIHLAQSSGSLVLIVVASRYSQITGICRDIVIQLLIAFLASAGYVLALFQSGWIYWVRGVIIILLSILWLIYGRVPNFFYSKFKSGKE